ncbi:hypothetical protein WSM22_32210 [Cytophagales bacterium WSM2-2]|nr:hypothetical protein WSM22_32210 [Cytophagales bacterium WSM2-2]
MKGEIPSGSVATGNIANREIICGNDIDGSKSVNSKSDISNFTELMEVDGNWF